MRGALASLVCLVGCDQVFSLDRENEDAEVLDGFAQRKRIDIVSNQSETLTDIPIAIQIKGDTGLVGAGTDLLVTAADGVTPLRVEVERIDVVNGDLAMWVRVPKLAANATTNLFLYFGGEPQVLDSNATWRDEYAAVWHLGGTTIFEVDSTARELQLMSESAMAPETTDGAFGLARSFDGGNARFLLQNTSVVDAGDASFSYSAWVRNDTPRADRDMVLSNGGPSITEPGYDFELGTGPWVAAVCGGAPTCRRIELRLATEPPVVGQWHHIAAVVDREKMRARAYLDGVETDSVDLVGAAFGSLTNTFVFRVGGHFGYSGQIDEVRLFHGALSAAWFAIEAQNLLDPASLVQLGDTEDLP